MSLMVSVSGVRGIVGESLTPQIAGEFAAAFGSYVQGQKVVVGRDARPSGPALRDAVAEMLMRCGCHVVDLGLVTTPGTGLMVCRHRAAGGVVITASHNPESWNGLKFLTPQGHAPRPEQAAAIWAIRDQGQFNRRPPTARGRIAQDRSTDEQHVSTVMKIVDVAAIAGRTFKVVLDSVNGAGCSSGRMLLERLGCQVIHLNGQPDGRFAHEPEPLAENLVSLCQAVRRESADIGFAQDPDADRLAIVDHTGRYIGEEYSIALAAKYMFTHRAGSVAINLATSQMVDDLARRAGPPCRVHRTRVGEAHVVAAIQQHACVLGGEGNGGVIDPRVVLVRDSLVGMALALQLMVDEMQPLHDIVAEMPSYTMLKDKITCPVERIPTIFDAIREHHAGATLSELDGLRIERPEGWILVRASNTEPLLRIIVEAATSDNADALRNSVMQFVEFTR